MLISTCLNHTAKTPSGCAYPTSPSRSNDSQNFKGLKEAGKSGRPQTLRFTSTQHYFQAGTGRPLSITRQCRKRGYLLGGPLCLGARGLKGLFLCCHSNVFLTQSCTLGSLYLFLTSPGKILTSRNCTAVVRLARFLLLAPLVRWEGW